jgi:predicted nucleic acid-binding protein
VSGHVFWDTNLLIYWIENSSAWSDKVGALFRWQESQGLRPVTSSLSLGELLVHPMRLQKIAVAQSYARLIDEMGCLHFGADEAWRFAEIRSSHPSIRPPDAIQLACASVFRAEYFITNDERLSRYRVDGIGHVFGLDEWARSIG